MVWEAGKENKNTFCAMTRKEGQKERRLSYNFLNEATNIFNLLGWVAHP